MTDSLGWGILGAGRIAGAFARDLVLDGRRIAAVASRDEGRGGAFAAEHGIPTVHTSYEALAADPDVDVIYVATPHSHHLEHGRIAIAGGKHVLVEKAFTTSGDDAQALVDAARQQGVFAMEAMWTRFLPTFVEVRERIAAGQLGEVIGLVSDHSQMLDLSPGSRLIEPSLGGGALLDLGIYNISLAHHLLGPATRIQASGIVDGNGVDHRAAVILEHGEGRASTSTFSMTSLGSNRASIVGTEGVIELDPAFYTWTGFTLRHASDRTAAAETYAPELTGRGMQFQAREVERAILAGETESPLMPLDETVAILRLVDDIRSTLRAAA